MDPLTLPRRPGHTGGPGGRRQRPGTLGMSWGVAGAVLPGWAGHGRCPSSPDVCAFCHKTVSPRELAVEAMKRQYHAQCFTCRTCRRQLAGQSFYQKDGRPLCEPCYQVTPPSSPLPLPQQLPGASP